MASSSATFIRLGAALTTSAMLGLLIISPGAPRKAAEQAASMAPTRAALGDKACPQAGSPLTHAFANLEDVVSISPLGGVTAPGEALPAPDIRVNTRRGETVFERRTTTAFAPAKADITAIERRIRRDDEGTAIGLSWRVKFRVCETLSVYYDDIDVISTDLMRRAGGLSAFADISGPDHKGALTNIRVKPGEPIGEADGFDVGLEDLSRPASNLVRAERYASNPYPASVVYRANADLLQELATDNTRAQCPLDYLPTKQAAEWKDLLGDAFGMRKAKKASDTAENANGGDACRSALVDTPGAAQGAWFTDAAHNGAASRRSAIALAPDSVNPERMILSLHGRLSSLTPEMVALPPKMSETKSEIIKDFLTFDKSPSSDRRVNLPFSQVTPGEIHCYERLRTNFVGPRINGVILVQLEATTDGPMLMTMEARDDAMSCERLEEPWNFSGEQTVFYR